MSTFLVVVLALALWAVSLYLRPFGRCRRCHGKRIVIRGSKKKQRPVTCSWCKGIGRRQRRGSRTVHKVARRIRREVRRQRGQRPALTTEKK